MCMTVGGGRGALHSADSDSPVAALHGVKTLSNSQLLQGRQPEFSKDDDEVSDAVISLDIIGKNVQSLQTELREEELMAELRTIKWDVVLLNETWREKKQERWRTEDGHSFCGAGGKTGEQGLLRSAVNANGPF